MFKLLNENGKYTIFAVALIWVLKGEAESGAAKHIAYGTAFQYASKLRTEEIEFLCRIITSETTGEFYNHLWELFEALEYQESLCFFGILVDLGLLLSQSHRDKALTFIS